MSDIQFDVFFLVAILIYVANRNVVNSSKTKKKIYSI